MNAFDILLYAITVKRPMFVSKKTPENTQQMVACSFSEIH